MASNGSAPEAPAATLDMKATFGPALREPAPTHFREFGNLCGELFSGKEDVSKGFQNLFFGSETLADKTLNDTGAYVRGALGSLGFDATSWMGTAPERPPPHSQLIIRRGAGQKVSTGLTPLQVSPGGEPGPQDVPPHLGGYMDGWMSAYHLDIQGETPPAGYLMNSTPEAWSDLRFTAACGSHAGMVAENLALVDAYRQAFAWVASDAGDPDVFKKLIMESFPRTVGASGLYLDVAEAKVGKKKLDSGNVQLSLDVPLLPSKAGERFPRLSELMQLFDPCIINFMHPKTGAEFMVWQLQDRKQHIHFYMGKDGYMAYEGGMGTEGPVLWDKEGKFSCDIAIECSMVLLDLQSVASIPFPSMTMRCEMDQKGQLSVKCVEAGEPPLKGVADYFTFDLELFRKLLVQGFELQLSHLNLGEGKSAIRLYHRFMFPTASVVTLVSQWFQDFLMRQLKDLDALEALGVVFQALADDAAEISEGLPPHGS